MDAGVRAGRKGRGGGSGGGAAPPRSRSSRLSANCSDLIEAALGRYVPACVYGVRVVAAAALLALANSVAAVQLETIEPRPFGYTVGDVLERTLRVDRTRDGTLDPASLPKPGRIGRWFQLRAVTPLPDGVRLAYQIVNSPTQPGRENLPSLRVRVIGPDGRARNADIGPFTVAMTPVAHFASDDVIDADDVRPDLDPQPIDTTRRRERVLLYAAALTALVAMQGAPGGTFCARAARAAASAKAPRGCRRAKQRAAPPSRRARRSRGPHACAG